MISIQTFKYKAMTLDGKAIEGTHMARTREDVVAMLRGRQQFPVKIQETGAERESAGLAITLGKRVKTKDLAIFCRQFYTMLHAGVSIMACLDILRRQSENKKLKEAISHIYEEVQKGRTLSEAMKAYQELYTPLFIHMVEAGEVSGKLDAIMDRMAQHFEKEARIANKVKAAMIYPAVLSVLVVTVVVFLLTFVMPTFVGMFTSSGVALPVPTQLLLNFSDALRAYWYLFAGGAMLIFLGVRYYLKTEGGRYAFDSLKLKLPVMKGTSVKIATSRFSRTLSTLMSSGIPLLEALDVVSRVVENRVIEKGILSSIEAVRKGSGLAAPIRETKLFPPMLDSMIQIGEESGSLDDLLDKTANFYDEEVETAIQKMTALLEPLMIILMAIVVGAIVIAMMLPIFDMVQTVA